MERKAWQAKERRTGTESKPLKAPMRPVCPVHSRLKALVPPVDRVIFLAKCRLVLYLLPPPLSLPGRRLPPFNHARGPPCLRRFPSVSPPPTTKTSLTRLPKQSRLDAAEREDRVPPHRDVEASLPASLSRSPRSDASMCSPPLLLLLSRPLMHNHAAAAIPAGL